MSWKRVVFAALSLMLLSILAAGCGRQESYTPSPEVKALWAAHPSPWDDTSARAAADDAEKRLRKHHHDFQLAKYYMERMRQVDPSALSIGFAKRAEEYAKDPRWKVLDALVNGTRGEIFTATEEANKAAPDDPYLLIEHTRSILDRKPVQLEQATDLAFKAVKLAPDLPDANGLIAYILLWVGHAQEAEPFARHATALDSNDFRYVQTYALVLDSLGRPSDALDLMEAFHKRHPRDPNANAALLDHYLAARQWKKMVPLKRIVAETDPRQGMSWVELALVFQRLHDNDSTFAALNNAVDAGFFDVPFFRFAFEEDLHTLQQDPRFAKLIGRMEAVRDSTRPARRREALSDPLDMEEPDLVATTLDGDSVHLADYKGETVVLEFWASWSGWSKINEERLIDFYHTLPGGATYIGVNVFERVSPDNVPALARSYAKQQHLPWPIWLGDSISASRLGIQALPSYVVIDPEGIIRYHVIGYTPYIDEILSWMVEGIQSGEIASR